MAVIVSSANMPGHTRHRFFELIGIDGVMMVQPIEPGNMLRVGMRKPAGTYKEGWREIHFPDQNRFIGDMAELARAISSGQPLRYSYDYELLVQETILRAAGETVQTRGPLFSHPLSP